MVCQGLGGIYFPVPGILDVFLMNFLFLNFLLVNPLFKNRRLRFGG